MDAMDGLLAKRRECMARRRELKGELTRLTADIAAIDRVFRMVDSTYHPEAPVRAVTAQPRSACNPFRPGKMAPAMLDVLRRLDRPVTSMECAAAMLTDGGFASDDDTLATVANRVSALLSQKSASGQVERAGNGHGRQVLWQVTR